MIEYEDIASSDIVRSHFRNIKSKVNKIIQYIPDQAVNRWKKYDDIAYIYRQQNI